MLYAELLRQLFAAGYTRVERDDRLLDIFPHEDREKGIELWEKWSEGDVRILRVKLPFAAKKLQLYTFQRSVLEEKLLSNVVEELTDFSIVAAGTEISPCL
jgi:hypothetical protein